MKFKKALTVAVLGSFAGALFAFPTGDYNVEASTNANVGESQAIYAEAMEINYPENSTLIIDPRFTTIEEYEEYLKACRQVNCSAVLTSPEYYTDRDLEIAAYQNLCANGMGLASVKEELNNICVLSQVPMGIPEEVMTAAVGTLQKTLPYTCNPFQIYGPLAYQVHLIECDKAHVQDEFGTTCESLKAQYESLGAKSLEEEIDAIFGANLTYQRIKLASLKNPNASIADYLYQLETLVILQQEPTDIYDDHLWNALFGLLDATLTEEENLHDTYIDLAIEIHNYFYPEEPLELHSDGVYRVRKPDQH